MTSSFGSGPITAKAALVAAPPVTKPATRTPRRPRAIDIMSAFDTSKSDMATIYMSPDPYFTAFKQPLDLRQFDLAKHPTAGLSLYENGGKLHLATMSPSTPAAKIKDWRSRIRGAWLTKNWIYYCYDNCLRQRCTRGGLPQECIVRHPPLCPPRDLT